ncbi:hypothetical protein ACHAXT_000064 [Thalassiosira profunda]
MSPAAPPDAGGADPSTAEAPTAATADAPTAPAEATAEAATAEATAPAPTEAGEAGERAAPADQPTTGEANGEAMEVEEAAAKENEPTATGDEGAATEGSKEGGGAPTGEPTGAPKEPPAGPPEATDAATAKPAALGTAAPGGHPYPGYPHPYYRHPSYPHYHAPNASGPPHAPAPGGPQQPQQPHAVPPAAAYRHWTAAAHAAARQYAGYRPRTDSNGKPLAAGGYPPYPPPYGLPAPGQLAGKAGEKGETKEEDEKKSEGGAGEVKPMEVPSAGTAVATTKDGDEKDDEKTAADGKGHDENANAKDAKKDGDTSTANNATANAPGQPQPAPRPAWNGPPPHAHGPYPHPHHNPHYAHHYRQWHAHHQAAARAGYHHYQQQQQAAQQGQQPASGAQPAGQHPQPHPGYPYWPHHPAYHAHAHQQQAAQQAQKAKGGVAHTASRDAADAPTAIRRKTDKGRSGNRAKKGASKKRGREEDIVEARDDADTTTMVDKLDDDGQGGSPHSTGTMSLSGFSMGSLDPSKRHKNQSIHRTTHDGDDLLQSASTLSEGKMILRNLSIASSYSAEFAALCGPSPSHSVHLDRLATAAVPGAAGPKKNDDDNDNAVDEGKTPKKRNTSHRKRTNLSVRLGTLGNLDGTTPGGTLPTADDSPTAFDLLGGSVGGADTPTDGMTGTMPGQSYWADHPLEEWRSLNGHLRGQSFTPLPVSNAHDPALGEVDANGGEHPGFIGLGPQLSWTTAGEGESPLAITPRCFGGALDSARSARSRFWRDGAWEAKIEAANEGGTNAGGNETKEGNQGGVTSILSMLSPTMREMELGGDGSGEDGSPLPLYEDGSQGGSNGGNGDLKTPLRRPPVPSGAVSSGGPVPTAPASSPWGPRPGMHSSPVPPGLSSPFAPGGYPGYYPYPPPPGHHPYNPHDRVRNLRGNGPPRHPMPPPHHLPPPSYHHYSPLTNVAAHHRRYGPHAVRPGVHLGVDPSSKRKCVPLKPPLPSKFQGDAAKCRDAPVPEFNSLVNFPGHASNKPCPNVPAGMRCCVMCGQACPCAHGGKRKSVSLPLGEQTGNRSNHGGASAASTAGSGYATIPTQNKGLCTICDVNVWIVAATGLEIKWCKGCKVRILRNFRPWAAFGDKGLATKCVRCRERQREKYALQKEEKEKSKAASRARKEQKKLEKEQKKQGGGVLGPAVASMGLGLAN